MSYIAKFIYLRRLSMPTEDKGTNGDTSSSAAHPTISIPTEARVIQIAKEYVQIYLRDQDVKNFLAQAEDMMKGDYVPTFNIHQNRWYVFFTDGLNSVNITMTRDLDMGTARSTNSKVISSEFNAADLKGDYSDLPLFTLSEFKRVVDLPHNQ